jgi:hypothetical protein
MWFYRVNTKSTDLDNYILAFQLKYNAITTKNVLAQFNEENIRNKSNLQYKTIYYYLALYYVILIYLEYKKGFNQDWNYYINKYKIDCVRKTLFCHKINLDKILELFNLPQIFVIDGINTLGIEENFVVENNNIFLEMFDITQYLKELNTLKVKNFVLD